MIQICLFEPEIPQNVGTLLRLSACFGVRLHIIEPCGFVWQDKNLKRAGMDYAEMAPVLRHKSWHGFYAFSKEQNTQLVFLDCHADVPYTAHAFSPSQIIIAGRESNGFEGLEHPKKDISLKIPMVEGRRSLNVAVALSMVTAEALRQTQAFPK